MAILYRTIGKCFLFPLHRLLWRVEIEGAERIPAGAAVLAPNHESLLDPFFQLVIKLQQLSFHTSSLGDFD